MQADRHEGSPLAGEHGDGLPTPDDGKASDAAVQAALASLSGERRHGPKPPPPGELKWKLTTLVLPSVMLLFVALYVSNLSAGVEPEIALFRAGGVSVVLAVLGRVAVSILGDDSRFVMNEDQISAMARPGSIGEYISSADVTRDADGADQPHVAAQAAGPGGKE